MSSASSVRYDSRQCINRVVFLVTSRNGDHGFIASSYNRDKSPMPRHEIRINSIAFGIEVLIWSIGRLAIKVGGVQLVFKNKQHIPCVKLIGLLHPSRWHRWFGSIIWLFIAFPLCIASLYQVDCLVQVISIMPQNILSWRPLRCMFDNCGIPELQAFTISDLEDWSHT